MDRLRVIDSHTAGEPTRVILEGGIPLEGQTILQQMADIAGESGKPDQTRVARLRRLFGLDLSDEMLRWMVREGGGAPAQTMRTRP